MVWQPYADRYANARSFCAMVTRLGSDWQAVEPRHSQDARRDAEAVAGGQQRLHAGVAAGRVGGADQVGRGLGLGLATGDAHHDRERVGLVGDGVERAGERAFVAGLADVGLRVRQQDGRVEREGRRVGIVSGADDAGHGGLDGADRARAVVEFNNAHAVVVVGWHAVLRDGPTMDRPGRMRRTRVEVACALL